MISVYRLENKYFTNITTNNFIACNISNKRAPHTCSFAPTQHDVPLCVRELYNPTMPSRLCGRTGCRLNIAVVQQLFQQAITFWLWRTSLLLKTPKLRANLCCINWQIEWIKELQVVGWTDGRTDEQTYRRKYRQTNKWLTSDLTSKQILRLELLQRSLVIYTYACAQAHARPFLLISNIATPYLWQHRDNLEIWWILRCMRQKFKFFRQTGYCLEFH